MDASGDGFQPARQKKSRESYRFHPGVRHSEKKVYLCTPKTETDWVAFYKSDKHYTVSTRFKPKFNIKKGDTVVVIAGDDKDLKKPRLVKEVFPEKSRVLVEGVNIITKHTKPSAQQTQGGIVKKEAPIHISNVMLWDVKSGAATRVTRNRDNGKLVRIAKKSGEVIK